MTEGLRSLLRAVDELMMSTLREPITDVEAAVRLVRLAEQHLPADQAGITLMGCDGTSLAVATCASVAALDARQRDLAEGPTFDSLHGDLDLTVADLATDPRWPRWRAAAAGLAITGVVTVRLCPAPPRRAVLTLYSTARRDSSPDARDLTLLFAQQASLAMRVNHEVWHLHQAIDRRTIIGQAEGVLMERFMIDADQAFATLTRLSSTANSKLHTIAAELMAHRDLAELHATGATGRGEASTPNHGPIAFVTAAEQQPHRDTPVRR